MKPKGVRAWLRANFGLDEAILAVGLGLMGAAGYQMASAWVGLVVPGGVLILLGLAPLRRLV